MYQNFFQGIQKHHNKTDEKWQTPCYESLKVRINYIPKILLRISKENIVVVYILLTMKRKSPHYLSPLSHAVFLCPLSFVQYCLANTKCIIWNHPCIFYNIIRPSPFPLSNVNISATPDEDMESKVTLKHHIWQNINRVRLTTRLGTVWAIDCKRYKLNKSKLWARGSQEFLNRWLWTKSVTHFANGESKTT